MPPPIARNVATLVSPLSLALYAAWAAVWFSLDGLATERPVHGMVARGCAIAFLIGFIGEDRFTDRIGPRSFGVLATVMTGLALVPAALAPYTAAPILLVLLAALLAARYEGRALWGWLGVTCIGLGVVMLLYWPSRGDVWISWFAYGSFQMFSALLMRYANEAERMSERLRALNADLLATRSLLEESARDSERLRLSRELHDVAGHSLTALKLNLAVLARDPRQPDPDRVALCAQLSDELLQSLRGVVQQMRLHEGMDLRAAIERVVAPFPRPVVHLQIADDARVDTLERAEALLRAVQEGVTNAARHSGADAVWVTLRRAGERVELDVRDDGRGQPALVQGNGLDGMRERLEAAGGGLTIARERNGVQLHAWLPAMETR